jgi:hypothetical protein
MYFTGVFQSSCKVSPKHRGNSFEEGARVTKGEKPGGTSLLFARQTSSLYLVLVFGLYQAVYSTVYVVYEWSFSNFSSSSEEIPLKREQRRPRGKNRGEGLPFYSQDNLFFLLLSLSFFFCSFLQRFP